MLQFDFPAGMLRLFHNAVNSGLQADSAKASAYPEVFQQSVTLDSPRDEEFDLLAQLRVVAASAIQKRGAFRLRLCHSLVKERFNCWPFLSPMRRH